MIFITVDVHFHDLKKYKYPPLIPLLQTQAMNMGGISCPWFPASVRNTEDKALMPAILRRKIYKKKNTKKILVQGRGLEK